MVDLIPSPGIGVGELLRSLLSGTNPLDAFPERSDQVTMPFGSYSHLAVKAYGLGLGYNLPASEFSRAVLPAAASAVFDIALPGLEVITGFPLSPELRGRPTNHPFYALVVQTAEDIVSDARTVDRMYRWYREGDLVAIAVDVVWLVTQQMADNPRLVGDLITQIVGEHIARTAVSSWLFPIRVAHGVLTSVNVGVSLASVLSSEVVTTFVLTDDLVEDDLVQVTGLIRDASLPPAQAAIGGATVTFFDENDNQVSVTITGSDGIFVADVPAGETRLRVVAEGFRAVNQFADVEPDAQSTFVFPTILMAPYAAEPGGVRGTVRSAVNLSPLSDAAVTVRYGVNNPDEEILGVATTSVTGAFELTGLPAGTHTAYVTMDGFVTEAVPVAIVAGAVLEGLTVSMVPEGLLGLGYRIVLTWGQDPRDLDSHLYTPVIEGRTYHVYYASRGSLVSAPYANLDVDDVTSFGPETITIQQVFPGEYSYSVYKFSGLGDLAGSGANVALYGPQGFIREWTVPLSGSGRWWNVFTLDGTTGAITGVNTVTNSPAGLPFATASAASGPKPVASN